jgi:hypothetical protein
VADKRRESRSSDIVKKGSDLQAEISEQVPPKASLVSATTKFDYARARIELEEAALSAIRNPLPADHPWIERLRKFCDTAETSAKTHIAMLATVLLARATDRKADLSRLTIAPDARGSYYARGLADQVVAPVARLLQIDLGARGPNPLNNSPYRGPKTMTDVSGRLRTSVRPVFDELLQIIDDLDHTSDDEARVALKAFAQVRRRPAKPTIELPKGAGGIIMGALVEALTAFVHSSSEGGKRAQAAAAGVLDALYGPAHVDVGKVNDPSRLVPGDVKVSGDSGLLWSLEVRDKEVDLPGLLHFLNRMSESRHNRAAILMVSPDQDQVAAHTLEKQASDLGVNLRLFASWRELVSEVVFHARGHPALVLDEISRRVLHRSQDLDVSAKGIRQWQDMMLAIRGSA